MFGTKHPKNVSPILPRKPGKLENKPKNCALKLSQFQLKFDGCMKEKNGMDRPPYGYFNLIRVHDSSRPKPEIERPAWLDDPRGKGRRADVLPDDFPRTPRKGIISDDFRM